MNRQNALMLAGAGLVAASLAAGSSGAASLYRNRADWEAAMIEAGANLFIGDTFDRDIENDSPIIFDSGIVSTGTSGGETNDVLDGAYFGNIDSDQDALTIDRLPANTFESITWTFPQPVMGFGANFFSTTTGERLLLSGDFGGEEERVFDFFDELGYPGDGFLGIVGEGTFREVTFRTRVDNITDTPNEFWGADNLSFGWQENIGSDGIIKLGDPIEVSDRQAVPESASVFATILFGATALCIWRRPKRLK